MCRWSWLSYWLNTFAGEASIDFVEVGLCNRASLFRCPPHHAPTDPVWRGDVGVLSRWRRAPTLLWRGNAIVLRRFIVLGR
jgi:hypothetical protein